MYLKGDTMKNIPLLLSTFVAIYAIGFNSAAGVAHGTVRNGNQENIKLGVFSVSLSVKDLEASKAFYEKLGFLVFGGGMEKNYLIMKNGNALIGLFQGMFEGNILTFNPGWDEEAKNMDDFDDIREIQRHLKENGISLTSEADENTSGPANLMLTDPDGNVILLDQHR
jgi:catechol 2,3-dioxygenase-like lactoylglutathione lyase family enzyme